MIELWVCVDCYFTHHGVNETVAPDREPLSLVENAAALTDWTDSETGEGIDAFSWSSCDGCGSTLGGDRFRLAQHVEAGR